ncbi:MAG: histidinol dehydrogenase [SAR202 cluster bacterium]|nr:histidinol dehydrogenase [SAR202 cluster bacterium]
MALLDRRAGFEEPVLSAGAARRTAEVFGQPLSASESVRRILAEVRSRGDDAVREFARKFDGATLGEIEVPRERWAEALRSLPSGLEDALRVAASRIRAYAEASMPKGWRDDDAGFGEAIAAIERVGLYVPGGTAAYPSTVLMAGIPARVAGVREIVLCTPMPNAVTLAAAYVAGVDRVFGIGGAQAIGAMAYGTANVPKVDKICGPGNIFVSIAKREVYGSVDIDGMYGPTETVVIADDSPDPALAAADLLAQAEHDEMASPVLITTSRAMAEKVIAAGKEQVARLERAAIAGASMERNAVAVVVRTVEEAVELANAFAPEHLCLLVDEPWRYVPLVRNAGGVFVGEHSPEVMGDYVAGPSHVMPTSGTARFASALSVHAFIKHVPVVALSGDTMRRLGPSASAIARAEGLTAHARAVELRLEGGR